MYLDATLPSGSEGIKIASRPIKYEDSETGQAHTLHWWTRLPAGQEFKLRIRKQREMADRLSHVDHSKRREKRHQDALARLSHVDKMALEKFNPFSPHQTQLRNYAMTYGMKSKPSRYEPGRMVGVGLTEVIM
eukprot:CAMPEP_0202818050 /NCGR_PEP_ID=MMETSP1389-20130828/8048_1 /ASSEMBLY_ACC=CAM_ASM_000865 /TAXON_ID=302021 /ORGANISM="Rhodomonas sp., Strain CCMP768" /LENGTH=132 /DNA_ID=CAMNT_0049490341 /DNA_START=129 /DNA_END=527 /DNA_ORIENTATION=-